MPGKTLLWLCCEGNSKDGEQPIEGERVRLHVRASCKAPREGLVVYQGELSGRVSRW